MIPTRGRLAKVLGNHNATLLLALCIADFCIRLVCAIIIMDFVVRKQCKFAKNFRVFTHGNLGILYQQHGIEFYKDFAMA